MYIYIYVYIYINIYIYIYIYQRVGLSKERVGPYSLSPGKPYLHERVGLSNPLPLS